MKNRELGTGKQSEKKRRDKQPENCSITSLTQTEPALVFSVIRFLSFLLLEKMYKLRGFSLKQKCKKDRKEIRSIRLRRTNQIVNTMCTAYNQ